MAIDIRPIVKEEIPAFRHVISQAFGGDAVDDEESRQRFDDQVDLGRTYAAFDDSRMVATAAAFTFDVSLPGGAVTAMGGLTMVGVRPTHRRRGLLNRLMTAHFDDCRDRGEWVSGLFASESSIYGRYGFGDAAPAIEVEINGPAAGVPAATDGVRLVDIEEARKAFPEVYEQIRPQRPGRLSRSEPWWEHRHFRDPEAWRRGASGRRYVVAYRDGVAVGYCTYRQKEKWERGIPSGTVRVGELFGIDAAAQLSLWSLVCSVDLFPNVEADMLPADFELPMQVANPRMVQRRILDGLYVRILDVPGALEARGYSVDDSLVLEIEDTMGVAGGKFRLEVSHEGAMCGATSDEADLKLDVATLSSLYLGADGAGPLHRVGKIEGDIHAVRRFDAAMRSDIAPSCPEMF